MRLDIKNLEHKKYKIPLLSFEEQIPIKLEINKEVSFADIEEFYKQHEKYPLSGPLYSFLQLIKTLKHIRKLSDDEIHLYNSLPDWDWQDREIYTIKHPKLFIKSFFDLKLNF